MSWQPMPERRSKESAREQYRRLAQQCLEMAATIQEGEGRDALIEMARVWTRLAETHPEDNSKASGATKETQPVVQQQQQVSPKDHDKD
jgi:hypothetical protein